MKPLRTIEVARIVAPMPQQHGRHIRLHHTLYSHRWTILLLKSGVNIGNRLHVQMLPGHQHRPTHHSGHEVALTERHGATEVEGFSRSTSIVMADAPRRILRGM